MSDDNLIIMTINLFAAGFNSPKRESDNLTYTL